MGTRAQKKRILIVDADADVRLFLSNLLNANAYDSVGVGSIQGARMMVPELNPDMIILDAMMENDAGIELFAEFKCQDCFREKPVLMLATLDWRTLTLLQKMKDAAVGRRIPEPEAYLKKPLEAEEVLQLVSQLTQ
ncbi:MAG: response regulator [Pseudomonadota bacterium]